MTETQGLSAWVSVNEGNKMMRHTLNPTEGISKLLSSL